MLFSTKVSSPYDIAVVQLQEPFTHATVPKLTSSFLPGKIQELVCSVFTDCQVIIAAIFVVASSRLDLFIHCNS